MRYLLLLLFPIAVFSQSPAELARYKAQSQRVTIVRDNWGVPHIYGKSDADAVFGLLYAQCEENFAKVEENNLEMMGRLAEIQGEEQVYSDLQMRMIYDTAAAIRDYHSAEPWLKKLMDAAADGINYYLYRHPETKPRVLHHFEPWFTLLRTNGSISATQLGGITVSDMRNLYPVQTGATSFNDRSFPDLDDEPVGSNGFAVGPSKSASGKALLYINPHVTFYFRSEVQMVSEEGLNVYGAVTWGTFFVFQGFNEYCGWMHTSGSSDVADVFRETVLKKNEMYFTKYDAAEMPVSTRKVKVRYKKENSFGEHEFITYQSVHGPVMGSRNGAWLSVRENNRSVKALMQSWLRTKTKGFADFKKVMDMRANTSDNTVFADNRGNIAYWHGNFMPRRVLQYDYSAPVDGSISATDWHGVFPLDSIVHVYNPSSGFIQNCNSTPFTSSGAGSPDPKNYPVYMAPDGENFRGINAVKLLQKASALTVDKLIHDIGYDDHLAAFDLLIPQLLKDFETFPDTSIAAAIDYLRAWNRNSSNTSVATTIAVEFGYRFNLLTPRAPGAYMSSHIVTQLKATITATTPAQRMALLKETIADIKTRFHDWKIPWGDINRYQRTTDGKFDDEKPSLPVGHAASVFGTLPSFTTRRPTGMNKRYGFYGNSFVACVEFGKKVIAKSIVTGGQSSDPASKHFTDQSQMYIDGNFKDVLFYKEDVMKHVERSYHPGE